MSSLQFKVFSFNGDSAEYIVPSWEQMGDVNFQVIKAVKDSGKKYDRVVALSKGGLTWARAFVDGIGMDELSSLRIKLYKSIGQKNNEPEIIDSLTCDITGKTVLLFDDVVDTGETYEFAKKYLLKLGAKQVDTAALFWKPHSVITPDYFTEETSAWIVFPHEINEFIEETGRKWLKFGLSKEEILGRYSDMGLPKEQVNYYFQLLEDSGLNISKG